MTAQINSVETTNKIDPVKAVLEQEKAYDPLNQCRRCGIKPGKYQDKDTGEITGVFLLQDARGYKICNLCKDKGFYVGKIKRTKADKKKSKVMKREMKKMLNIPHITLDHKGEIVE